MVSRLIDLDVALVDYCDGCKYEGDLCTPGDRVCGTVDFLLEQPVVDAVEVVRCKDCKYYVPPEDGDFLGLCTNGKLCVSQCGEVYPEETYFCPYGEKEKR